MPPFPSLPAPNRPKGEAEDMGAGARVSDAAQVMFFKHVAAAQSSLLRV